MFYKLQKRFDGYRKIGADIVYIPFDRDILLDIFNQFTDEEKPEKGNNLKKDYIRQIAESKCYQHEHTPQGRQLTDKIILFLGTAMVMELLIIGIQAAF